MSGKDTVRTADNQVMQLLQIITSTPTPTSHLNPQIHGTLKYMLPQNQNPKNPATAAKSQPMK